VVALIVITQVLQAVLVVVVLLVVELQLQEVLVILLALLHLKEIMVAQAMEYLVHKMFLEAEVEAQEP
jgi:hypothetical protein